MFSLLHLRVALCSRDPYVRKGSLAFFYLNYPQINKVKKKRSPSKVPDKH